MGPVQGSRGGWRGAVPPVALAAVTAALGWYRIDRKSLWFDEAIAVAIARMPTGRFVHTLWNDEANMSLYYLLLRGWVAVGGTSEAWIRSLSVLLAVVTVLVTFHLGRHLFGPVTGAVAGLVLAGNAFFVQFAQEARSYMLTALAAVVATACFVHGTSTGRRRWWVGYAAAVTVGVYAHLFALAVPLGHLGALAFRGRDRRAWRQLVGALAAAGVLVLPALRVAYVRRGTQVWWNPPVTFESLRSVFAASAGGGGPALAVFTYALAGVAVVVAGRELRRSGRVAAWPWVVAVTTYALPSAGILGASVAQRITQIRYFSVTLPALALLVAAGIRALGGVRMPWGARRAGGWRVGLVALAVLIGLQVGGLRWWYGFAKEDWRGVAAVLAADGRDRDAVVLFDPYRLALVEYYRPSPWRGPGARLVYPGPAFEPFPLYRDDRVAGPAQVRRIARRHARVWLLVSEADDPARVDRSRAALAATHRRRQRVELFRVTVERYDRR